MLTAAALVAALCLSGSDFQWSDDPDPQIAAIKKEFRRIKDSAKKGEAVQQSSAGHSVEIVPHRSDDLLVLLKLHAGADWHEYYVDIYYAGGKPFFVFWKQWEGVDVNYDPETGGEAERERTVERRFYLGNSRVVQGLHKEGTYPSGKSQIAKARNKPIDGAIGHGQLFKSLSDLATRLPKVKGNTSAGSMDEVWALIESLGELPK